MLRSRLAQATLIGCLAALASFCALEAWAAETYSIVAQSTQASAGTGRRPLAERIAAANLPIITQTVATTPAPSVAGGQAAPRASAEPAGENMAVAAVRVDRPDADAPLPPSPAPRKTPPVRWPFSSRQPTAIAKETEDQARQAAAQRQAAQRQAASQRQPAPRQASARSSGKGLSSSSPAAVTR